MAVSIDDVAARANVSTATVSRALRGLPRVSPATRAKVLAIADELGYVPSPSASRLATGRTRTVGVLAPFADRWFFGHSIEGIDSALRENGFNLLLFSLGGYERGRRHAYAERMVRRQIDALVVISLPLTGEELDQLQRTDIPMVAVGGPVPGCAAVRMDDVAGTTAAVEHLIGLGHTRIGHLHGAIRDDLNFVVPGLRYDAFEATMARAGLPVRPEWTVGGDFTVDDGVRAAVTLLDGPGERPTAVFCASDEMALGLMFAAHRRGLRIPEDLSVIGIDDHDFAAPAGLTTIAQDPRRQGYLATRMLLRELAGTAGAVQDLVVPFELKVRSSTAPPN
ncbi:LacI family DNA-binding transcriptional regulator [Specibacter cremeus]|uniref:LacI family DNA-binding transcriptional regulator n=1 Tax=Specibacter cremeus TaxID=1629051 RepID=UPI000F7B87FD|nr:LacI family DNA-binding transcriptional regulator [Specibacter cremeus]